MTHPVFSIYNADKQTFCFPFAGPDLDTIVFEFIDAVCDRKSPVGKSPASFTLYHIANHDPETGAMTGFDPVKLGSGSDFLATFHSLGVDASLVH